MKHARNILQCPTISNGGQYQLLCIFMNLIFTKERRPLFRPKFSTQRKRAKQRSRIARLEISDVDPFSLPRYGNTCISTSNVNEARKRVKCRGISPSPRDQSCFILYSAILSQKCKKFRVGERCCQFECLDDADDESGPDIYDAAGSSGIQHRSVLCLLGLVALLMVP